MVGLEAQGSGSRPSVGAGTMKGDLGVPRLQQIRLQAMGAYNYNVLAIVHVVSLSVSSRA